MKQLFSAGAALALATVFATASDAAVIDVTHTVSGSAGAWVHNFTITNNLPGDQDIYFFGVKLAGENIVGSPQYFGARPGPWSNAANGGSSIVYDNNWITDYYGVFYPGGSMSGFKALDTGVTPIADVAWFAYSYLDDYYGPECFHCGYNPGFEGVASLTNPVSGVPEPATWAMMIVGFGLAGAAVRRGRQASGGVVVS